jgi:hypothetical protein
MEDKVDEKGPENLKKWKTQSYLGLKDDSMKVRKVK